MRTVPFKEVFDRTIRLYGRDPRKNVSSDLYHAISDHINQRVRTICQLWRWPEWEITEERAFRPVWTNNDQYYKVDPSDGKPSEVFYLGDSFDPNVGTFGDLYGYYRVKADAPTDPSIGMFPTETVYFEPIDTLDTFIEYDQRCRKSIGMVIGVYRGNPRNPTGSMNGGLKYMPSERGIDVTRYGGPTVFITYKIPCPKYTMTPFVNGRTYHRGDVVYDFLTGECFQSLKTTTNDQTDVASWRRLPFLEVWKDYVCHGSFADSLLEYDQGGNDDLQARMLLSQAASERADGYFQREVDVLAAQGQTIRWHMFCCNRDHRGWCESMPFNGGTVTTLTEDCVDETGFVYPTPPPQTQKIRWEFHPEIISIDPSPAESSLSLIAFPTSAWLAGSRMELTLGSSGDRQNQSWNLLTGPANPANPGERAPNDYNPVSNNKHWEKAG